MLKLISDSVKAVEKYNMLSPGDSVLISVSGGPDSVFLIYFFNLIKSKYNLKLYAFHLDHSTRSGDSTRDAGFVEDLCSKLNIKLFSEKINVLKWCLERKLNFQEGARLLRKSLLEKYCVENSIKKIAVAHNADDNLETFVMNLMRGAGLRGLGGIKPVNGKTIRPLILSFKKDIADFLNSNNISYCIDRTNLENKYFRNKIRNNLIPYLENEFGNGFKGNILNTIENLRLNSEYIENKVLKIIKEIQKKQGADIKDVYGKGFIKIAVSYIKNLDGCLKTALIFKLMELVKGDAKDIISANVRGILKFCYYGGENKKISLPGGIFFIKEGEFIYIYDSSKINLSDLFKNNQLNVKPENLNKVFAAIDEDEIAALLKTNEGKEVDLKTLNKNPQLNTVHEIIKNINESGLKLQIKVFKAEEIDKKFIMHSGNNEAYMDINNIKFPVIVRSWHEGDKFTPLGMNKEKKLQDFFIDLRVPFYLRSSVPVFCDSEKIIWVGNLRINDRVKFEDKTRILLYLKLIED